MKGIKHFRTYLQGVQFKVQTDHNPLTYLSNLKDSNGRLARWALTLQTYNFTIEHRIGKANANANGPSQEPESATKVGGVSESQEEEQSRTNTNVGNQEMRCWIRTIMRTHMRIQLAPGSRGPGSNHEL